MESGQPLSEVWGAEGSMLPAKPGSQSAVRSVASVSGLGPPGRGRVGPAVKRLRGVSVAVEQPAYSSIPTEQESGARAGR